MYTFVACADVASALKKLFSPSKYIPGAAKSTNFYCHDVASCDIALPLITSLISLRTLSVSTTHFTILKV